MSSTRTTSLTPGVRAVLALVVLTPMLSLGWFTLGSYREAADDARSAERLEDLGDRLTDLVELSGNLSYEGYFAPAVAAIEQLGIPASMAVTVVGFDLESALNRTGAAVDENLARAGLDALQADLDAARSFPSDDPFQTSARYEDVTALVVDLIDGITDEMGVVAGGLTDAAELDRAQAVVLKAIDLREHLTTLVTGSLAIRFVELGDAAVGQAADLFAADAAYDRLADALIPNLVPGSLAEAEWDQVVNSPEFGRLAASTSEISREVITLGLDDVPWVEQSFLSIDTSSIQEDSQLFRDSMAVLNDHVELVDGAATDLSAQARVIGEEAQRDQQLVMLATLAVTAIAAAAVVAGGWWIGAPLLNMSRHVETIRSGDLSVRVALRGPREVTSAAEALNEATEHLRLAEAQVSALAREDLDNPVLDEEAPGRLGESLQGAVEQLATSLSERDQFRRRLAHESTHDGLTGLLNRPAMLTSIGQGIARSQRSESELAVMIVDLDSFREINDRHGHAFGDRVLRETARAVVAGVRAGDVVGRLGSDEFVVVAEAVSGPAEAVALAERVLSQVTQVVEVDGVTVPIEAGVGVALTSSGSLTADEMLRDADLAVYQSKTVGGRRVEVCDLDLRHELAARASIETELRAAIDAGEMDVYYQTIHRAHDLGNYGVEALVRWRLSDGSLRFPDSFIPIAERSDLIVGLDNAVLDRVCGQLSVWQRDQRFRDLNVAFNVSARHLAVGSLVDDFVECVTRHDVPADRLCVEVTESSLLADLEGAAVQLSQLRQLGATVAIDDFGTGYTSLSHLRQLPFDKVKIDRSFVANLAVAEDRKLINMIADVGHTLGAQIVAEGVESSTDIEILRALGVDYLQGFNFSRPGPADVIEATLMSGADVPVR